VQIAGTRWLWLDLAQHLERLWGFLMTATADWPDTPNDAARTAVDAAITDWHGRDPLAQRLPESIMDDREV
jgi:hypothetical protein